MAESSTLESSNASACNMFKNIYSTILLIFAIVILHAFIFQGKTRLAQEFSPILAFFVLWVAVLWLTMIEGGQASKVGLVPVDLDLFKESHPLAHKSMAIVAKGDNLDRYLMGRQFMVVLIVFCVNFSGEPVIQEIWGFPELLLWFMFIFPFNIMTLFTCMIGQLNSQVNASHCMLDYINNYFALFTLKVAMFIEWTGLLHTSYLIAMLVAAISGKPIQSKEPPKEGLTLVFFWFRCLISVVVLAFCLAVVITSIFMGRTKLKNLNNWVSVIIFFFLMSIIGMLEGMQIAFFAVAKIPKADRGSGKFAKLTCDLLFRGEGHNLPGFMIGRQMCVVSCMLFVGRVTTITSTLEGEENILNVSDSLQKFFEFGNFQGALVTTIIGSISWQLVASAFPIEFLSFPGTYILLVICLFLESTGICSGAWVLAAIHKKVANFQRDEVYIGTAEERLAKEQTGQKDEEKLDATKEDLDASSGEP